jgi:hypothetical protein
MKNYIRFRLLVPFLLLFCLITTSCNYQLQFRDEVKGPFNRIVHIVSHPKETYQNMQVALNDMKVHWISKRKVKLVIPMVGGKIPDGSKVEHKFLGINGPFVFVVSENVKVYHKPSEKAVNVLDLPISSRVRPIYIEKNEIVLFGEPWKWAFVQSETGQKNVGWVNLYGLSFTNDYLPVEEWYYESLSFCRDDYCANYNFNENAWFLNKWRAEGSGIKLAGKSRGRLYRHLNLLWAKKRQSDEWIDVFVINSNDDIFPEIKFKGISMTYD